MQTSGPRGAAVFAQRIATVDQLARGRIILGLGTGEAMTYLMAAMASGDPNAISTSFNTAKPDMPLSQILNIEKNL